LSDIESFSSNVIDVWLKPSLKAILGETLVKRDNNTASTSNLTYNKIICLYFSSVRHPLHQKYTEKLKKFYEHSKSEGRKIEIIFVSADSSDESYREAMKCMPWLAIPCGKRKGNLMAQYYGTNPTGIFFFWAKKSKIGFS
jgi:hypothetical protein